MSRILFNQMESNDVGITYIKYSLYANCLGLLHGNTIISLYAWYSSFHWLYISELYSYECRFLPFCLCSVIPLLLLSPIFQIESSSESRKKVIASLLRLGAYGGAIYLVTLCGFAWSGFMGKILFQDTWIDILLSNTLVCSPTLQCSACTIAHAMGKDFRKLISCCLFTKCYEHQL